MKRYLVLLLGIMLAISACEIKKPSLPVWEVDLHIPLINELFYVSDLVDSVNIVTGEDELLHLMATGETSTTEFGMVPVDPDINIVDALVLSGDDVGGTVPFNDSEKNTHLSYGKIALGQMQVKFSEILPGTTNLKLVLPDFVDSDGHPLVIENDGSADWQAVSLVDYELGVWNSMDILQDMRYQFLFNTNTPVGTEIAKCSLVMNERIEFSVFQGSLNLRDIPLDDSLSDIDVDYPGGIDQAITLQDGNLQIDVRNQLGFRCIFTGMVEARRGSEVVRIPIVDNDGNNYVVLPAIGTSEGTTTLQFNNNISTLMQIMPEHVEIVNAKFSITSASGMGTVHWNNKITADYTVRAPFRFILHEYPIEVDEAIQVEISADNQDLIRDRVKSAEFQVEVLNKIPVGGYATAYFSDNEAIDITDSGTYIFTKGVQIHSFEIEAGWQDPVNLSLSESELDLFTNSDVFVKWVFSFEASDGLVEIYATSGDYVHVRGMLSAQVKVEEE